MVKLITVNIAGNKEEKISKERRDSRAEKGVQIVLRSANHKNEMKSEIEKFDKIEGGKEARKELIEAMENANFETLDKTFDDFKESNDTLKGLSDEKLQAAEAFFNKTKEEASIVASSTGAALFAGRISSQLSRVPLLGGIFAGLSRAVRSVREKNTGDIEINTDNDFKNKNNAVFRPNKMLEVDAVSDHMKQDKPLSPEDMEKYAKSDNPAVKLALAKYEKADLGTDTIATLLGKDAPYDDRIPVSQPDIDLALAGRSEDMGADNISKLLKRYGGKNTDSQVLTKLLGNKNQSVNDQHLMECVTGHQDVVKAAIKHPKASDDLSIRASVMSRTQNVTKEVMLAALEGLEKSNDSLGVDNVVSQLLKTHKKLDEAVIDKVMALYPPKEGERYDRRQYKHDKDLINNTETLMDSHVSDLSQRQYKDSDTDNLHEEIIERTKKLPPKAIQNILKSDNKDAVMMLLHNHDQRIDNKDLIACMEEHKAHDSSDDIAEAIVRRPNIGEGVMRAAINLSGTFVAHKNDNNFDRDLLGKQPHSVMDRFLENQTNIPQDLIAKAMYSRPTKKGEIGEKKDKILYDNIQYDRDKKLIRNTVSLSDEDLIALSKREYDTNMWKKTPDNMNIHLAERKKKLPAEVIKHILASDDVKAIDRLLGNLRQNIDDGNAVDRALERCASHADKNIRLALARSKILLFDDVKALLLAKSKEDKDIETVLEVGQKVVQINMDLLASFRNSPTELVKEMSPEDIDRQLNFYPLDDNGMCSGMQMVADNALINYASLSEEQLTQITKRRYTDRHVNGERVISMLHDDLAESTHKLTPEHHKALIEKDEGGAQALISNKAQTLTPENIARCASHENADVRSELLYSDPTLNF